MGEPSLWNEAAEEELFDLEASFNPSWESRPSGTKLYPKVTWLAAEFQPLMGEPSLWNSSLQQ